MTQTYEIRQIMKDMCAPESQLRVQGWVRTRRGSKKFSFIEINDGTSPKTLQVVADASLPNYEKDIQGLNTGDAVDIVGKLVVSPGKGQKYEMQASEVTLVGKADPETYPLQKKEMTFEYLREIAHLRMRTSTFSSMFRLRSRISMAIHDFFRNEGFFYVHSPIITTTDGEGAGELFTVTTLPVAEATQGKKVNMDFKQDFFQQQAMLCVTGQLEAELFAMGMGKVYTFGPTFRAENSNTARHLAEFWMIEPEMAFWDLTQTMGLGERMVRYVAKDVLENASDELDVIAARTGVNTTEYLKLAIEKDFVRVTYTEAVDILKKSNRQFEFPVEWGCDLKSEHERFLCETHFQAPTFVTNYPGDLKAFYMYLNDDNKTVRATDLLVPGIGEIIGGSQREHRLDVLTERMKIKGIHPEKIDWYLDTRRFGTVPHAGFGLGLERLCMWVTGMTNIRDVIPFPRTPGNCLH